MLRFCNVHSHIDYEKLNLSFVHILGRNVVTTAHLDCSLALTTEDAVVASYILLLNWDVSCLISHILMSPYEDFHLSHIANVWRAKGDFILIKI